MSGADTAKRLGVTIAGLSVLVIASRDHHGRATGPAFGIATHNPRLTLRRNGMLKGQPFGPDTITPAGRAIILEARKLGW